MKITQTTKENIYKATIASVETMELRGYEWITNLFADSCGLGAEDEPALTGSQLMRELDRILAEHPTIYAFITEAGQFQVNIGIYIKNGNSKAKKIGNNTYKIALDNGYAIRLHDTNILTFDFESGTIALDNGGYPTRTTHKRMNQYLPSGVSVYGKDFETWVNDSRNDKTDYKLENGMRILS